MTSKEVLKYLNRPIFGGESDTEASVEPVEGTEEAVTEPKEESAPEEKSGEEMKNLLKQVEELNNKLSAVAKENEQYKAKEQQAARAQQTREESLEQDLTEAQQTIHKMDEIIRYTAIVNAIQSNPDLEFHSAKHVLRELDMNAFDLDVDLENGTATVNGIESELKRIARECEWLVKSNGRAAAPSAPATSTRRGSGAPPTPASAGNSKTNRRRELSKRFPVIMHNRSGD